MAGRIFRMIIIFIGVLMCAVMFSGCAFFGHGDGRSRQHIDQLNMYNFWHHLSVTIEGSRLHFFGHYEDSVFTNVVIAYSLFGIYEELVSSTVVLTRNGWGRTQMCSQIFPKIISISGTVQFRV